MKGYINTLDGVRGFAVLAVILFHAYPTIFPGGFVGVDIFFVISGYVITRKIVLDIQKNRFSVLDFYCGRITRLLPLFLLVVLATTVVMFFVLPPAQLLDYGRALLSSSLFSSNIYFWRTLGYFEAGQTISPLLHTWSLSVEWQFYLLYPVVFSFFYRRCGNALLPILLVAIALSVVFSEFLVRDHAEFAFYMLPSRMFELLLGATVAVWELKRKIDLSAPVGVNRWLYSFVFMFALGALIAQILFNIFGVPFPGINGLFVGILSTVLLVTVQWSKTLGAGVFATRPIVHIGYISYGLYLWHYPVLELASLVAGDTDIPLLVLIALGLLLFFVAEFTGRYVERPLWRRKEKRRLALLLLSLSIVSSVLIFAMLESTKGQRSMYVSRLSTEHLKNFNIMEKYANSTHLESAVSNSCLKLADFSPGFAKKILECAEERPTILVIGDSHAINVYNGLARLSREKGAFNVFALASPGCGVGNLTRRCDIDMIQEFVYSNSDKFTRIIYTEAGFRLFRTTHGVQSERRDFVRRNSLALLHPDIEKLEYISSWLEDSDSNNRIVWLTPWVEPHINLNGLFAIQNLKIINNDKTFSIFSYLSKEIDSIVNRNPMAVFHINTLRLFSEKGSYLYSDNCLFFSDTDHLSVCGEDFLADALNAEIFSGEL